VTPLEPKNVNLRSQDLEPTYFDAGMFYWFDVKKILKSERLWTENSGGFEISEMACQDIDNESDWQLAELKYRMLHDG
jgi:N-acylneuraminate cytidylyltransferase